MKGAAFNGQTEIRLPARTYTISIDCGGAGPIAGSLTVPPGTNSIDFRDVVKLQ